MFDPDVLTALVRRRPRRPGVLAEYLESRRLLEVEAAGLAAERARRRRLERLAERVRARCAPRPSARATNPAAEPLYQEADIDFHRAIIRAARQPRRWRGWPSRSTGR